VRCPFVVHVRDRAETDGTVPVGLLLARITYRLRASFGEKPTPAQHLLRAVNREVLAAMRDLPS